MLSALGQLLPLAVAAAVSSVPITVTILLLLSSKRGTAAIPFLIGWVAGMAGLVVVVAAIGASALPARPFRVAQESVGIAEIVLGAGVLVVAVVAWRRAAHDAASQDRNPWLDRVERLGPVSAAGLAVALNLRPKGLLLGAAAGLAIAGARLKASDTLVVVVIYLVLATSTVTVPIIVTLASPTRMQPRLVRAEEWLDRHGAYVTVVVLVLVGFVIVGAGLTHF